jgi:hypothetical protein
MVLQGGKGSFDCGCASHSRSTAFAQDDRGDFRMARFGICALACALVIAMGAAALGQAGAGQKNPPATAVEKADKTAPGTENKDDGLVIGPAELPGTYPHGPYQVIFQARGSYVPVLHWSVASGALPPGITLDDNGTLHGEAERAGEFQFAVVVRDGGKPQQVVQKGFVIKVVEGITVAWKVPAHVTGNRIDGSVEVTNSTAYDMDLTFDVKAVAENGRATEIGYQHFPMKKGTIGMTLPFGETLPHGAYVVYVNVNGEVAKRNAIYKQQMRTPAALQVVVGP